MRQTIKQHKDFLFAETDATVKTALFILRARQTIFPDGAKYGLVVTKKTFKLAVDRNRAKRLLRTWIRLNQTLLDPGLDYIFIARREILDATLPTGMTIMAKALGDIGAKNE